MNKFKNLLRQPPALSENNILLLLAVGVGVGSGVSIWLFRMAIEGFHVVFFDLFAQQIAPVFGSLRYVVVLVIVGLVVRWLMDRFIGTERHGGVAGIIEAVALGGGRLRFARMPIKAVASALSIGGGASVGPEAPSVQIGANLGSLLGQMLNLSEQRVRLLVAAGAASAVAAAFRAPLAGVFFALEVILNRDFNLNSFGVVVLASVVSSAVTASIETGGAELALRNYHLGSPLELPLYVVLGLVLAPVSAFFIRLIVWQHDFWHKYLHGWYRTALAGALVGIAAIWLPQIMGDGKHFMNEVLNAPDAEFTIALLLVLSFVKLVMTTVSIAGGFVGGTFAPSLFVGIMFGGAFGRALHLLIPGDGISAPQAYAVAGMAGVLAGVVRSPVTAILLVFELTNDYRLILPIMLTTVVCLYFTERLQPDSLEHLELARKGIRLEHGQEIDIMQHIPVRSAMSSPAPTIAEQASLVDLRDELRRQHTRSLCVVDDAGGLVGIVTLTDLQRAYEHNSSADLTVADICTRQVITVQTDDVLWTAIRNMGARDVGRLPVIEAGGALAGMLSRGDIMRAYNSAIARRLENQHAAEQVRLNTLTGAHVLEVRVKPDTDIAGKSIADLHLPSECVIASIKRRGKLIVPHGSTELHAGDVVTLVAAPEVEADIVAMFQQRSGEQIAGRDML